MPQYRKLHVKTVESLDVNELPDDFIRLMWVLLPLGLDREGRGMDYPGWIKSKIFPLRDDVTSERITTAMDIFCERGMVVRYCVENRRYFYVPTFHHYQGDTKRESESVLPAPPIADLLTTNSGLNQDSLTTELRTDSEADSDSDSDSEAEAEAKPAPRRATASLDLFGAQRVIEQVTGWPAIPGNPEDVKAYLGVVMDISTSRNGDTVDYLEPYFAEFRKRYPRSTKMFWLTDWAVQGVIPPPKGLDPPGTPAGSAHGVVSVESLKAQGYTNPNGY